MNQDKIIEEATKAMHAEVCCPCDPQGCDWTHTREIQHAWVLADAGLLAWTLPTREEIASTIYKHAETFSEFPDGPVACRDCGTLLDRYDLDSDLPSHQADVVLALLRGQEA